ncbi:MAG: hypothetical protein KatS3mg077_1043 [Candidatus Binatia bacterium]|nr:MAG: hypothetical protein KatS3mg077_1043 [Candidatus Binatia bacterium]
MGSLILTAVIAGAWGGSLVGLAEAAGILWAGASVSEFGLFPFGFWSYGLFGATLGLVSGSVCALVPGRQPRESRRAGRYSAGVASLLLSMVVLRYHLAQRLFGEQFPSPLTGIGFAAYLGLFATGLVMAWFAMGVVTGVGGRGRYGFLRLGGFWLLGLFACVALQEWRQEPEPTLVRKATGSPSQPNVVLIVADTLRADALGIAGAHGKTPHIDALARDGVWFRHAYAQSSWTRPSIATILTGQHPAVHGAVRKFDPLPETADTLAELLQRQGYWTAAFVTNINVAPIFNFQQGFHEYHYLPPSFYFGASDSATRLSAYKLLRLLRERFFGSYLYFYHYYQDAQVVTERVREWLDQAPPQPFFLLVHYMDPHDPYLEIPYNGRGIARVVDPNPPPNRANEMRRLYAADVTYLDQHLGAMLNDFKRRGLYENTVIVFVADHGEEFYEHGGWWHGTTLYEEQIRVPLIVRLPQTRGHRGERSDFAQTLDIVPTILAQAGAGIPAGLPGRDLFGATPAPAELYAHESLEGNEIEALRWNDWKLIIANPGNPRGLPEVALFDLGQDPAENTNLAPVRPEIVRQMRELLVRVRPVHR